MGGEAHRRAPRRPTDVLLEVALFDPIRTAATGRTLGIGQRCPLPLRARPRSGAGACRGTEYRHAADPRAVRRRGERAGRGRCVPPDRRRRSPSASVELERLAGIPLEPAAIERPSWRSGFGVDGGPDALRGQPPSWRHDITARPTSSRSCAAARLRQDSAGAGAAHRGGGSPGSQPGPAAARARPAHPRPARPARGRDLVVHRAGARCALRWRRAAPAQPDPRRSRPRCGRRCCRTC